MSDAVLVINAGSSSIKFSVFVADAGRLTPSFRGQIEGLFTAPHFIAKNAQGAVIGENSWSQGTQLGHRGAIEYLRTFLRKQKGDLRLAGLGHRVAHGGVTYSEPVRVTRQVLSDLEKLIPLAPLHQPNNLAPIRLVLESMPEVPQVACFDTAFHHTNPVVSQMFALPKKLTEAGVRRYGFHGLSYEYIASVLPDRAPVAAEGKTVVLHLGSGSSMCAMSGGKSVASTMGFSALDGLAMGTRCGALDPGVILFLLGQQKMDLAALEKLLYTQSGLLGVSGISSDLRVLLDSQEPDAKLALALYVYRIGRELGSLAGALGGLQAMVFTAGVGENAASIRERVCRNASWLGVSLDPGANANGGPCISKPKSRVEVWVLPTNEELMIARHTLRLLGLTAAGGKQALPLAA
jgi:acetate kinase